LNELPKLTPSVSFFLNMTRKIWIMYGTCICFCWTVLAYGVWKERECLLWNHVWWCLKHSLTMLPMLTSNSQPSCLSLLSARITHTTIIIDINFIEQIGGRVQVLPGGEWLLRAGVWAPWAQVASRQKSCPGPWRPDVGPCGLCSITWELADLRAATALVTFTWLPHMECGRVGRTGTQVLKSPQ
jgi:hypothetical protein